MLARVAQTLYWTARDLERAESFARLLEVGQAAALEGNSSNGAGGRLVWEPLVRIAGDLKGFLDTHRRADERSVPWFLTFGRDNPDSIIACLNRARENARSVRDRLPTEVWEGINDAWLELAEWPPERITRDGVYPFCQGVRRSAYLILGLVEQTMRRDEGWQFMRLGRFLERAERSTRLVQARQLASAERPDDRRARPARLAGAAGRRVGPRGLPPGGRRRAVARVDQPLPDARPALPAVGRLLPRRGRVGDRGPDRGGRDGAQPGAAACWPARPAT